MNEIYALIVGIERYDQADWDVESPCANALAVAEWVLSIAARPENIHVFVNYQLINKVTRAARQAEVQKLCERHVDIKESARWEAIDSCARQLSDGVAPGSRLLVYWSGHGFTDDIGKRIFICEDYTAEALRNRVFDCSTYLRYLLSDRYGVFAEQILLVDTCATHTDLEFVTANDRPGPATGGARQIAFFATPEGKYARGEDGRGIFTQIALATLKRTAAWPEYSSFSGLLLGELKKAGETPFHIEAWDGAQKIVTLVGKFPRGNALFDTVWPILSGSTQPEGVIRRHFLRTAEALGQPALARAQGLAGMIRELASLQDPAIPGDVPYGLLEFMLRVSGIEELAEDITKWLEKNAAHRENDVLNIRRKLAMEEATQILVVEIENDDKGQITSFEPCLKRQDLTPAAKQPGARMVVKGWEEFCERLQALVASLRRDPTVSDFEIHIVCDLPLFDRPFHLIPLQAGKYGTLGEDFVVLVRNRERLRSRRSAVRKSWETYADALRPQTPSELDFVLIPSKGVNLGRLLEKKGLCYAGFLLAGDTPVSSGLSEEKETVRRLLKMGVPYFYWLHREPSEQNCSCWSELGSRLKSWLSSGKTLGAFPGAIRWQRAGKEEFAYFATLMWDDPQADPFMITSGVEFK